ncbi:MGMT family protein [Candidatus Saccharibacteria bacterium]|nr:MGMT family protein [Candidatus Saccharibacteria bacterium]
MEVPKEILELALGQEGTEFERAVWRAISEIPPGETRTYGQIAAAIGRPGAVRAVGTACGKNKFPIIIPCHRVVGANGCGGYAFGVELKRELLRREQNLGES